MKEKKKHRGGKVLLCILLVLLLAAGVVCYLFRDVISVAYFALTTPGEVVESRKEENDRKQQELLQQLAEVTMRDLTDEERAKLNSGELSYEDALALIRGETVAPVTTAVPVETTVLAEPVITVDVTTAVSEPHMPETTTAATTTIAAATTTAVTTVATTETTTVATTVATTQTLDLEAALRRQEEIIAEIYLLRATYLNEIDNLIQGMKDTYDALPKERKNLQSKIRIAERTMPKGYALEDECDAKMDALLTELTGILQAQNLSTAIVDEIRETYKEQKELKMAELYNQYGSKLEK